METVTDAFRPDAGQSRLFFLKQRFLNHAAGSGKVLNRESFLL
jgi:hypothetical protein